MAETQLRSGDRRSMVSRDLTAPQAFLDMFNMSLVLYNFKAHQNHFF